MGGSWWEPLVRSAKPMAQQPPESITFLHTYHGRADGARSLIVYGYRPRLLAIALCQSLRPRFLTSALGHSSWSRLFSTDPCHPRLGGRVSVLKLVATALDFGSWPQLSATALFHGSVASHTWGQSVRAQGSDILCHIGSEPKPVVTPWESIVFLHL